MKINRRRFMQGIGGVLGGCILTETALADKNAAAGVSGGIQVKLTEAEKPANKTGPAQKVFPRWKGFNLDYFFNPWSDRNPREDDFRWIRDFGFDFVRLPMTYRYWTETDDVYKIKESSLEKIDKLIEWGQKYGIHTSVNFHRGPGYCVNPDDKEPFNLWKDQAALDAFSWHWAMFAKRYKGIASKHVSFDLLNEPPRPEEGTMTRNDYERVVRKTTNAIRERDPQRLVIVDGVSWGNETCPELIDLNVGQSARGYQPMEISHYKASWVNGERFPDPIWPDSEKKKHGWNRKRLEDLYRPWAQLAEKGVGVHCGECGCYNKTPHTVFLAWFRDVLEILKGHGIGFALWNFRGTFGILDSGRTDVAYEDYYGRKLDRKLLTLMQEM